MTPRQSQQLQTHVTEIAKLLYDDAQAKGLPMGNLLEIEMAVRSQLLQRVSPKLGIFYRHLCRPRLRIPPNPKQCSGPVAGRPSASGTTRGRVGDPTESVVSLVQSTHECENVLLPGSS
jgi:hypothetical protein